MSNLTDLYINGANAFNSFFNMLHLAILESMPDVVLSGNGASVWRGYRVDAYKDLAKGLFDCEIYTSDPKILIFQEGYHYSKYKPIDPRDQENQIKATPYYYPFRISLDLYRCRFFLFTALEQFQLLRNFVSYASSQALIWQHSEVRSRPEITSKEFLQGSESLSMNPVGRPSSYGQVSVDYLDFIKLQEILFEQLKSIVLSACEGKYEWFRPNANWRNWDYRGYRLKLSGSNAADYVWKIKYAEPEKLAYSSSENIASKPEAYLDLLSTQYFDQSNEIRESLLHELVKNTLSRMLP